MTIWTDNWYEEDIANYFLRTRTPVRGSIAITGKCNLRCQHCFVSCHWSKAHLDHHRILDIAKQASQAGCIFLNLTGGEPLFHPDFPAIYSDIWDTGMKVTVTTNGTLINSDMGRLFRERPPFATNISLYGIDSETYKRVTDDGAAYDSLVDGLNILKREEIPFLLQAVMLKTNKRPPAEIEHFASKWNAPVHFFTRITSGIDRNHVPNTLQLAPEEIVPFYEANLRNHGKLSLLPLNKEPIWNESKRFNCGCGLTQFHVDCQGFLYPCKLAVNEGYDLASGSFDDGWSKKIPRARNEQLALPDEYARSKNYARGGDLCPPFIELQEDTFDDDYYSEITDRIQETERRFLATGVTDTNVRDPPEGGVSLRALYEYASRCSCSAGDDQPYRH